jgi:hypothetical protein
MATGSRRIDTQIVWVVVFSLTFWLGIWKHEVVSDWIHRASIALQRLR